MALIAASTTKSDLIVPEVWADAMQAEFEDRAVIPRLARVDNTLEGVPGDTVHFPKFNVISTVDDVEGTVTAEEADTLTEGTAMVPAQMTASESVATVLAAGKAVEITDEAALHSAGDPMGEIRRQLGLLIARKIDTDLKTEAEAVGAYTATAPVLDGSTATVGKMSWDAIVDAMATFGDQWDPQEAAGIVIHAKQHAALMKDDKFVSADSFGDSSVMQKGAVGSVAGIPVFVSNRVTVVSGTEVTYKALLVKRDALALLYKRRPVVEIDRNVLARKSIIASHVHYAVKRLDPKGVCVLTTT